MMEKALLLLHSSAPPSSMLVLGRLFNSFSLARFQFARTSRVHPIAAFPQLAAESLTRSGVARDCFKTPTVMASSCKTEDAKRLPYVPLPSSSTADKTELFRGLEAALGSPFSSEPLAPATNPLIIIISGPSGVGKDAVIKRLQEVREGMHFVVTATSREKRPGEIDGKDYYFVSKEEFLSMIERNELLEYALVYGQYKGIPRQQIREFMAKGYDIVLRVDIQGAATLRSILGNSAIFIFLVAESEAALVKRLINRKTETSDMLLVRIATAREEVKHMKDFDYVVVNAEGKLENAVRLVESIIDAEKARVTQRKASV